MKLCTKCGGEGPFRRHPNTKDRLTTWCRDCLNAKSKECRLRNIEHYRAVNRRRYKPVAIPQERGPWRRWTLAEEDFLVEHFGMGTMSPQEIADRLGRSWEATRFHARRELELRPDGNDWRADKDFELEIGEEEAA